MAEACVVFEDPFVDRLWPISLARPVSSITCGAYCLSDLLPDLGLPVHYHVRRHLHYATRVAMTMSVALLMYTVPEVSDLNAIVTVLGEVDIGVVFS